MHTARIQKRSLLTSCQDFCKVVMSQQCYSHSLDAEMPRVHIKKTWKHRPIRSYWAFSVVGLRNTMYIGFGIKKCNHETDNEHEYLSKFGNEDLVGI